MIPNRNQERHYLSKEKTPSQDGVFLYPKENWVPQIVITGGPSAGKTTLITHLQKIRPEYGYIPEAATEVINSGWPLPSEDRPWTQEWQNELQLAIGQKQLELEAAAQADAQRTNKRLIIQDRGILDLGAYLSEADKLEDYAGGITVERALTRYKTVIYLGWIANKKYETDSNKARFEDSERAAYLGQRVLACWEGHPNLIRLDSPEHRIEGALAVID